MSMRALHEVHDENYGIRKQMLERAARIDKLGVDRSRWTGTVMPRWSPEAEAREERLAAIRADLSLADRIQAWRRLFALTATTED